MSVRMKLSHSKTASRRAHHRTGAPRLVATASGVRRRHFADPATGMYRGKQIIAIGSTKVEASTKAKKKKASAAEDSSKSASKEAKDSKAK